VEPDGQWPAPVLAPVDMAGAGVPPSFVMTASQVAGISDVVQVVTSGSHTCARTLAGEIWCWGSANQNALGDGTTENRHTPGRVPGIDDATGLAAGGASTCAVVAGREVWCWGNIDIPGMGGRPPTRFFALDGIEQVEVSSGAVCVRAQGDLRCWGFPLFGGTGRPWPDGLPPRIAGMEGASDVSLGEEHVCVVRAGEVWCWGSNRSGRVAEDAPWETFQPWRVAGVSDAVDVEAGYEHTCVILADAEILCWGSTAFGARGVNPGWLAAPVQGLGAPTIQGQVLDAWGFPIPLARVTSEGISVGVDAQGEFALPGLPAGTHTLRAVEPTYAFAPATRTVQTPGAAALRFTGTPSPLYRSHLPLLERAPE
jgi:alpha-tubulin suppressor-like RCC1 family protein